MPEGLKYCGNCGVHMNRTVHIIQWLFSRKGLPVLLLVLALLVGAAAWYVIPKLRAPVIEFDLDMGWYTPGEENIIYRDENKSFGYVNNMILVFFTKDATDEQITEVVNYVDGEVVGILPGVRQYQIQVTNRTEEELEALREELMQFDVVKNAVIDFVAAVDGEEVAVPDDPWTDYSGSGLDSSWDEAFPDGTNWWVEAAHILSAWQYQDSFSQIMVGIVDNGFDTAHEDFDITVLNADLNSVEKHGTHVAGIIGAKHNNSLGISGVMNNVELFGVDSFETDEQIARNISLSTFIAGLDSCLHNGCRVVNLSAGLSFEYVQENPEIVEQTAREYAEYLVMMLDAFDEDFIVVKSAGNSSVDTRTYSGYFSSIHKDLVQEVLDQMELDGVKLEKEITADDVMNSIIVVGAVDYPQFGQGYRLADFSNYGDEISVCAPGVYILSTVPGGYAYMNGTSMSTPIVTGITAMVWSVDPEMTAAEVKDIIVSTATEPVQPVLSGDQGTYFMVDAGAAVAQALQIAEARAAEPSESTEPSAPVRTGTSDKWMPYFDRYVGEEHYEMKISSLVTAADGVTKYYWDTGIVDASVSDYVFAYMAHLLEDTYQFELIRETDGEYYYTYLGTGDVNPLHDCEGMSEDADNCYLWIKLSYEADGSIYFQRWCSANFDFIEVLPEHLSNITTDAGYISRITEETEGVLSRVIEFYYDDTGRVQQIQLIYLNRDGSEDFRETKTFAYENGLLTYYEDTGIGCEYTFSYDDTGKLMREVVTGDYGYECVYFYDNESPMGCVTTFVDRTETTMYQYQSDGSIQAVTTIEYLDGSDTVVESKTWRYQETGGQMTEVEYPYDGYSYYEYLDHSFPIFTLRKFEQMDLIYYHLEMNFELGSEYFNSFFALYLKDCQLEVDEDGFIIRAYDQAYDRAYCFEYVKP